MEGKENEKLLQVRKQREYGFFLAQESNLRFYNCSKKKKNMFTDDGKAIPLLHSLGF